MARNRLLLLTFQAWTGRMYPAFEHSHNPSDKPIQTVTVFLIVLTSALQLLVQKMNYKRDLARIELITSRARRAAWGPKMTPASGQRKVRVSLGEQHDEDGFVEGTKFIEMVVEGQGVYIVSSALAYTSNSYILKFLPSLMMMVSCSRSTALPLPSLQLAIHGSSRS